MKFPRFAALAFFASASVVTAQLPAEVQSDRGEDVPALKVRPGYRVTRALPDKKLKEARFIEFSEDGKTLYLSQRKEGAILALRDPNDAGVFQTVTTFVKNRDAVQGMDAEGGWLYFSQASTGSVSRARDTNGDGVADDIEDICPPGSLPKGGGHPFEGLLVTKDSIYATSSDPTNMTEDLKSDRMKIYVFNIDGSNKRIFASGIRNTEKLRYRPGTTEIWGFDHGSDNFGVTFGEKTGTTQPITDLNPPEEFNLYVQDGFYGHPFLSGNRVPRPEFAKRKDMVELATKTIPPGWNVGAHWAVLGFTWIEKDYFGTHHQGDCFFAAHGSWNAIPPVGACVERLLFDDVTGKPYGSLTIVDCQMDASQKHRRWARPVDCAEAADGTIVWSSDEPPALYRISKSAK